VYWHLHQISCQGTDLYIDHIFWQDSTSYQQTDVFPEWVMNPDTTSREVYFTDLQDFDPAEWTQYWVENSTLSAGQEAIQLSIASTGSQLWHWDRVPHSDVMEAFVTVMKADGSNNLHIRMVADTTTRSSQDIYLELNGVLHNWWYQNTWQQGNRATFEWQPGDIVHKLVRVENDTLYAKVWHQGQPEPMWMLTEPTPVDSLSGGFGIGAHRAGVRYILNIGVATDGGPAPRTFTQ
jgi:hypothetical protein